MKYFATFFLLLSLSASADAQISIDFPDFIAVLHDQNSIQTFAVPYKAANPSTLGALVEVGDTNVTWDLSVASYIRKPQSGIDTAMVFPSDAVLATDPAFTSTNEVVKNFAPNVPTKYFFFQFTNQGIFDLGITQDSLGVASKIISYSPPVYEARIPMRYDSTWESTSQIGGVSLQPGEIRIMTIKAKVDAWGQVQLPNTTYTLPALRVKKQIIIVDSIAGMSAMIDTSYQYFFCGNNIFSVTITTDSKNVITNAEYAGPLVASGVNVAPTSELGFTISQNPASETGTKVIYTLKNDGPVNVEVMDELGKSVRMLQSERVSAGQHIIRIDPGMLTSGAYFIRLISPEMTAMKKLIISR